MKFFKLVLILFFITIFGFMVECINEDKKIEPESLKKSSESENIKKKAIQRIKLNSNFGKPKSDEKNPFWRQYVASLYLDDIFNSTTRDGRVLKFENYISSKTKGNLAASIGIIIALAAIPYAFPDLKKRSFADHLDLEDRQGLNKFITTGLVGVSESIMSWVEKSVDDIPNLPRLDAQECMKRGICEAHNQPKKYGLMGLALQLFFPPYVETDEPSRIVSKYQLAARYGRQDNANCATQFDGCMVNFLDLVQGVINLVF